MAARDHWDLHGSVLCFPAPSGICPTELERKDTDIASEPPYAAAVTPGDGPTPLAIESFAVIGAGRAGSVLARALRNTGLNLAGYTTATEEGARRAARRLGQPREELATLVERRPALWVVAVPDHAIGNAAEDLAGACREAGTSLTGVVVAHTSGAVSVARLGACARLGATTLSLHPLQTLTADTEPSSLRGCRMAVTAMDEPAEALGFALAERLGGLPFRLPDSAKPLYHAAATVASNYLVTLTAVARDLAVAAGMDRDTALDAFAPLSREALENVSSHGPEDALTGPISRGDAATVAGHLEAIEGAAPSIAPAYRALGLLTLDLAEKGRRLGHDQSEALRRLLRLSHPADRST